MAQLKQSAEGHDVRFMGTFARERMAEVLRDIDLLVIPCAGMKTAPWYCSTPWQPTPRCWFRMWRG